MENCAFVVNLTHPPSFHGILDTPLINSPVFSSFFVKLQYFLLLKVEDLPYSYYFLINSPVLHIFDLVFSQFFLIYLSTTQTLHLAFLKTILDSGYVKFNFIYTTYSPSSFSPTTSGSWTTPSSPNNFNRGQFHFSLIGRRSFLRGNSQGWELSWLEIVPKGIVQGKMSQGNVRGKLPGGNCPGRGKLSGNAYSPSPSPPISTTTRTSFFFHLSSSSFSSSSLTLN